MPGIFEGLKPYNIVIDEGNNSATIDLYGEVVDSHPTDWWTGKPIPGNFIALDEFLKDLEELKTKDSITVHINSVGGSFYAGLAIYNRLRSLSASVTTINDGLAASAGSIIFMAGDKGKRKVNAGSNLMVHNVLGFLFGYYNVAGLEKTIKTMNSHDKALVAVYKEATDLEEDVIREAMNNDTYMTGKEAVDNGWADEVIGGEDVEPVNMALSPDHSYLMANGRAVAAAWFGKLPANIQTMSEEDWAKAIAPQNSANPAPQVSNNPTNNNVGGNHMEFTNLEELRNAAPELLAQAEEAARAEGVNAERARIQAIEEIEAAIGDAELVNDAKYGEKPMNAEQLAFAAMKKHAAAGTNMLAAMAGDMGTSNAAAVTPAPAPAAEPKAQTEDEQAEALLLGAIPANMKKEDK